jgi:Ca2+-binding EF-hand superfamily protein
MTVIGRLGWDAAKLRHHKKAFDSCARTVDGAKVMELGSLARALEAVGLFPSPEEVHEMWHDIGSDEIQLADFILVSYYFGRRAEDPAEITRAFAVFDDDGDGQISVDLARSILKGLKHPLHDSQIDRLIEELAGDGDGVDYAQIVAKLCST